MNIRAILAGFLARALARCKRELEQLLTPRFCMMGTCLGLISSVAVQFDSSQTPATRAFELLSLAIYLACALRLLVRYRSTSGGTGLRPFIARFCMASVEASLRLLPFFIPYAVLVMLRPEWDVVLLACRVALEVPLVWQLLVRFEAGLRVESGVAARRSPGS